MNRVQLIQVGIGTVGGRALELIAENRSRWRNDSGIDVSVAVVVTRYGALVSESNSFSAGDLVSIAEGKRAARTLGDTATELNAHLNENPDELSISPGTILLDASTGVESTPLAARVLAAGGSVVYSNKAPLAQDLKSESGTTLWGAAKSGRVRYETTCGAGLPVISTLASLLETGDEVLGITGCLSGTLGAIFSDIADGKSFSDAIVAAKNAGYTEPDPRDDLSGLDVARKALILARTIGRTDNLSDIAIESLVPESLADCSVSTFLERVADHNQAIASRNHDAVKAGAALKYVAKVPVTGPIKVGIEQVPKATVLGALQGPENIISIRTNRYGRYPLTISGPGAGADVTAAGMLADMLELAKAGN